MDKTIKIQGVEQKSDFKFPYNSRNTCTKWDEIFRYLRTYWELINCFSWVKNNSRGLMKLFSYHLDYHHKWSEKISEICMQVKNIHTPTTVDHGSILQSTVKILTWSFPLWLWWVPATTIVPEGWQNCCLVCRDHWIPSIANLVEDLSVKGSEIPL